MATYRYDNALRPCVVSILGRTDNGRLDVIDRVNALFHCWCQFTEVIPPSPIRGGHNGGSISDIVGIVEFKDGTVRKVNVERIQFIDNKHEEYSWRYAEKERSEEKENDQT